MGLDIENGALGAEYEISEKIVFFCRIVRIRLYSETEFRISLNETTHSSQS